VNIARQVDPQANAARILVVASTASVWISLRNDSRRGMDLRMNLGRMIVCVLIERQYAVLVFKMCSCGFESVTD
jgi:hypothetical protein